MITYRKMLVALAAVVVAVCAAQAAPARKPASVKWPGGQVTAEGEIGFKARGGKVLLNFSKNVRATAQGEGQSIELHHADRATAEVDAKWQFDTIKADGSVRFTVLRKSGDEVQKTTGQCGRVTIHNRFAQKLTGDQRVLVADLIGNVLLTMPPPKAAGAPTEPMTLEGERGQVWLTAEGYEGTISAQGE